MGRLTRIAPLTVLLSLIFACAGPLEPSEAGAGGAAATALVDLTNAERMRAGLPTLRSSDALVHAAQIQADQSADSGTIGHVLPNASLPHPLDRLAAVGYAWQAWGENLAVGQPTAADAVSTWMTSSGHRANILSTTFTELGGGFSLDAQGRSYYVQVFGRPKS